MRLARCLSPLIAVQLVSIWLTCAANADTLIVGVEASDQHPYYAYDEQGFQGFARELLDAFAQDFGHHFQYEGYPADMLPKLLVQELVDFNFPDHPLWAQAAKNNQPISYSLPLAAYTEGTLVLPQNGQNPAAIRRLGTAHGFVPWAWMAGINRGEVIVEEAPDFATLIQRLLTQQIDGAYLNIAVAQYRLSQKMQPAVRLVYNPMLPHRDADYYLSTLKKTKVLADFNRFLNERAGMIAELKLQYGIP